MTVAAAMLGCTSAFASCFDLSSGAAPIDEPLRPLTAQAIPHDESGKLPDGPVWAAVHAEINQPMNKILKDLVAHQSTRSSRVNKMSITSVPDPRYFLRQNVQFKVDPFLFVSVKWTEMWAFFRSKATAHDPERVVVSYEKVKGTSHIEHLCGNYVLEKLGDNKTDVFVYEEAKATGRSEQDTLKGLEGNLQSLRALK